MKKSKIIVSIFLSLLLTAMTISTNVCAKNGLKSCKITYFKQGGEYTYDTYFKAKWKKVSGASGYQIAWKWSCADDGNPGSDGDFTGKNSYKIPLPSKYVKTLKARVRAYKMKGARKKYGKWSKWKKAVTYGW